MVLRWGEPASILKPRCTSEDVFDVEVWTYENLGRSGRTAARYIFYRRFGGGAPALDPERAPFRRLLPEFVPQECRRPRPGLSGLTSGPGSLRPMRRPVRGLQGLSGDHRSRGERRRRRDRAGDLLQPPVVSTEGLDGQKNRWATSSDPAAKGSASRDQAQGTAKSSPPRLLLPHRRPSRATSSPRRKSGSASSPGAHVQAMARPRRASPDRGGAFPLPPILRRGKRPIHRGVLEAPLLTHPVSSPTNHKSSLVGAAGRELPWPAVVRVLAGSGQFPRYRRGRVDRTTCPPGTCTKTVLKDSRELGLRYPIMCPSATEILSTQEVGGSPCHLAPGGPSPPSSS